MAKLLAKDQLLEQKAAGRAFTHFTEPEIAFLPTYRYDPGTDRWDTRHVRSVAALRAAVRSARWLTRVAGAQREEALAGMVRPNSVSRRGNLVCLVRRRDSGARVRVD